MRLLRRIGVLLACLSASAFCVALTAAPHAARGATPLAIRVVANHFVNGAGQTIRLLGVNREGSEYACVKGTGYAVGPEDAGDAAAIASWQANAVRIPINEDCWLGINGLPAYGTAAGYRQMIESYVSALNAHGIYAILDLQWTAPGAVPSNGLRAMPDDHSPAFWRSVAGTFAANPAVVFDAFNEPHSVSWTCWRDGGCSLPDTPDGTPPNGSQTYTAVGMQAIVSAIRAAGAHQPILLAGLAHGNDLSGWLANLPSDPARQLAASFHVYQPNSCSTPACWDSTVAPVTAAVPVTTVEFSESDCTESFDNSVMQWDDAHGVGYLGWGWFILTPHCQSLYLITGWNGTPAFPNGTALHDHLSALAAAAAGSGASGGGTATSGGVTASSGATTATPGAATSSPDTAGSTTAAASTPNAAPDILTVRTQRIHVTARALWLRLRASRPVTGRLSASSTGPWAAIDGRRRPPRSISLGAVHFSAPADRWRAIRLALRPTARWLAGRHWSYARLMISVTGDRGLTARLTRIVALSRRH